MKTTLLSILAFTVLVLYFVKKPELQVTETTSTVATEVKQVAPVSAPEFAGETTIAPKVDELSAATEMTPEAVNDEIESLQQYVDREDAITRLNDDSVTPEERAAFGKVFERLLALRSQALRLKVQQVQAALEQVKTEHESRVLAYVGEAR